MSEEIKAARQIRNEQKKDKQTTALDMAETDGNQVTDSDAVQVDGNPVADSGAVQTDRNPEADSDAAQADTNPVKSPDAADILYEVDVHMNTSVLYDYMLRHTYTSLQGLIATILGVMCILFTAQGAGVIYLVAGIIIIMYLPWNLFLSAQRQALSEAFKKPLHYIFTDEGIYVSQSGTMEMQKWDSMYQAVATSKSIIVYTSKVNASVFPRADLGDDTALLIEIICKHMNPKKVKIRQ